ncbi:MAG: RecQ family ATP-dependent DNA helicase [Sphingobacteriales bacterium]|nr:MAG: RecQ family ATP-dependent DNA helicase [Sphingobacteriales bacterium]TAF79774.1 MAG: RecQ family ATP-dependent DNA helicase [Sphingobacteriales bacterium]
MTTHQVLKKYWGFDNFRPLQLEIIQSILNKHDTLALLPTGGGKSLCFQIPAMVMEGICIVISPLIALMKDQVENLNSKGIQAISITSGLTKREIDIALDNCIYGKIKFLYLSPERLFSDIVTERIKHMKVNLLAIDEAHCISQWGYDFRPPYLRIASFRNIHPQVTVLALTASATHIVQNDIVTKLNFTSKNIFKKSFERKNLSYAVLIQDNKLQKLIDVCTNVKGTGIVYASTRKQTLELSTFLNQHHILADYYHAGLDAQQRSHKQNLWKNNKIKVIVATNAFGMGIDKPDVRFVLHYTLPESLEAYYQEAGRAGRDEKKAYAVMLYHTSDRQAFERKYIQNFPSITEIKKIYHHLANYFQLAIGAGEGLSFEFNIADFCNKFKTEVIETINAIKFLERDEYITLSENALLPSRLQFIVDGENLYRFQVENHKYDGFIKNILRTYGGAFDNLIHINETDIAKRFGISINKTKAMLNELNNYQIITYAPQSHQPQLYFIKPRWPTDQLIIDTNYYTHRKTTYYNKMQAILAYAENEICRNLSILKYFNEKNPQKCGICDVCLRKKKDNQSLEIDIQKQIITLLKNDELNLHQLLKKIKKGNDEDKINALRNLLDAKLVKNTPEGYTISS